MNHRWLYLPIAVFFSCGYLDTDSSDNLRQESEIKIADPSVIPTEDELKSKIIEAESAELLGAVVASNREGFTGKGFVDYLNATNDFAEWNITQEVASAPSISFRYSNGSTEDRPMKLEVNGTAITERLSFPPTDSWTEWKYSEKVSLSFKEGLNTIRLTAINKSGANIDHLLITPADLALEGILQAETATMKGAIVNNNHTGYTSRGFADFVNKAADYVEWTLNTRSAGKVELIIRYANGSYENRPLLLFLNGAQTGEKPEFAPTGSWKKWSDERITVNLKAGSNKVRLTASGESGPNIDYLKWQVNPAP